MGCTRVMDEPAQDGEAPRRKFDDVASLFGTIVPPPGSGPRPAEDDPVPFAPRRPSPQAIPLEPRDPPVPPPPFIGKQPVPLAPTGPIELPVTGHVVQLQPVSKPAAPPDPVPMPAPLSLQELGAPPRPRPTEVPWPDAFEPRPNFRRREPRNWTWLLLIPVGFVVAVGFTMLDPRTIRNWLDANVLHRVSVPATTSAPLLAPPPQPAATAPAAPVEAPILYPALPTSPVPVPPGTEVSPPPPDPTAPTPPAVAPHITIQYRRNIPGSDGEARRIAALLQSFGGSTELHPNATTVRVPTITYYNPSDKAAAAALATALANEAVSWTVHTGTTKNPLGTLDVWLP